MNKKNVTGRVTITQYMHLQDISFKTASKEYKKVLLYLKITNRNYLLVQDLIDFGVL